jgi:HemY protein
MARLILFLALATGVAVAAGWFASEPGSVTVNFRGEVYETYVGVVVVIIAGIALAAVLLYAVLSGLISVPRRLRAWRERRSADKGLKALARGMVAVAAGDARTAEREAQRAGRLLDAAPLTLLLSAQSAQLQGDEQAAEKYFREMLARPDTEFLGLRGMLLQAGRAGDRAAALAYAQRAADLRPDSSWVQRSLFELSVKSGLWVEAEHSLRRAVRRGAIDEETGARHRAALLLQQSNDAERRGYTDEARNLARRALRAAPGSVPAALRLAGLNRTTGRPRAARRVIERAWRSGPHPQLAAAYGPMAETGKEGSEEARALARAQGVRRLADIHPLYPESHLAMAEASLDAKLWGEARSYLAKAERYFEEAEGAGGPPARLYRLLARVEEEEKGDAAQAARWLALAGEAAADPRWLCSECGHGFATWHPCCPGCQGFDTLAWGRPEPLSQIAAVSGAATLTALGARDAPQGESAEALPPEPTELVADAQPETPLAEDQATEGQETEGQETEGQETEGQPVKD